MFKIVCFVVGLALLLQASPASSSEIGDAVRNGNWDVFNTLLRQYTQNSWVPALAGNVENLQPDGNSQVFGHSISAYKEWHNDNGKLSESGKGVEVVNNNGQVTRHEFNP